MLTYFKISLVYFVFVNGMGEFCVRPRAKQSQAGREFFFYSHNRHKCTIKQSTINHPSTNLNDMAITKDPIIHACQTKIIMNQSFIPRVVEDEPPHEFYANLVGHKPKSYVVHRQETQKQECDDSRSIPPLEVPAGTTLIPIETTQHQHTRKEKQSVYRRFLAQPVKQSKLSLDISNKGFRMLARMGWKESEGGLGRSRQGMLEPIKARPAKNMGIKETKQKTVRNERSEMQETKAGRRQRIKDEAEKERVRSKRARLLISSDIPEEYHVYL